MLILTGYFYGAGNLEFIETKNIAEAITQMTSHITKPPPGYNE